MKLKQMSKKKTVPVLISIDALGNQTKKLLLPNDSSKIVWIPSLAYQVDNNKILLAGKLSGKYQRIKVINPGK